MLQVLSNRKVRRRGGDKVININMAPSISLDIKDKFPMPGIIDALPIAKKGLSIDPRGPDSMAEKKASNILIMPYLSTGQWSE
jgi:hypothetical protein